MIGQSYHGVNGEPVADKDGNHSWEARYNENGNELERIFSSGSSGS